MQVQVLRDLKVTGYVGTPSFLMTILEKAREAGVVPGDGLKLQVALVAAEMLPETLRKRFKEEFGIQVRQAYGTADVGSIGYECFEAKGMHMNDEIVVELLDPASGKQVAHGEIGEVVVTLPSAAYPLIRFATGDLSIGTDAPCPCGRTSARLLRIVGRVDQVTKVKGMFVHPEQVSQLEKRVPEIGAAQLVISRAGHEDVMTIRAVPGKETLPSDALREKIADTARELTRLRGEVVFVSDAEMTEKDKKILDARKWD
jgi:phenylacetate-CoA ligase